jgi:tetratricopeptide (TPR) repeat protein
LKYLSLYNEIKEFFFHQNLREKNINEIKSLIQLEKSKSSEQKQSIEYLIHLFALIRQATYLTKGYYPYNTQFITVIALIYGKGKGRLAQVKTGQGKSIIVSMLAAYLGVKGYFIDIVTTADSLAKRDAKEMVEFFSIFGLSVTHCCDSNLTFEANFNAHIVYGTPYRFECGALYDEYDLMDIRRKRPYQMVIVDEVDSMFIDRSAHSTRIMYQSEIFHFIGWMYKLLMDSYEKNHSSLTELQLKNIVLNSREFKGSSQRVQQFILTFIDYWMPSVKRANDYRNGIEYVIENGEVKPVDYDNTGEIMERYFYSNSLHQLIEYKEGLFPSLDHQLGSHLSHITFFARYSLIYGLSGTMGAKAERNELQCFYQVDTFDVPVHVDGIRIDYSSYLLDTDYEWYDKIAEDCMEQSKRNRPVLVLFESIKNTIEFQSYLSRHPSHLVQLLNGLQEIPEENIVADAGKPGMITIATNLAGRGTDIRTWKEAESAGGTHVILSFLPINIRVENQAKGRTARQGKNGSTRFILNKKNCKMSIFPENLQERNYDSPLTTDEMILSLKKDRSITEEEKSIRRQKIYAPLSIMKDTLVKAFCTGLPAWKANYDDFTYRGMIQQWVSWFTLLDYSNTQLENDGTEEQVLNYIPKAKESFNLFMKKLDAELRSGTVIKNPEILHEKALSMMKSTNEHSGIHQAISLLKQVLVLDPYYSVTFLSLGDAYARLGNESTSKQQYQQAITISGHNLSIYQANISELAVQIIAYQQLKNYSKAKQLEQESFQIIRKYMKSKKNYDLLMNIALLFRKYEVLEAGMEVVDYAMHLDGECEWAYNVKGLLYMDKEQYPLALQYFQLSLQKDPNYTIAKENMGWLYYNWACDFSARHQYQEAYQYVSIAIQWNSKIALAYNNRAVYANKIGRPLYEQAADCRKALEIDPNCEAAKNNLKSCL